MASSATWLNLVGQKTLDGIDKIEVHIYKIEWQNDENKRVTYSL